MAKYRSDEELKKSANQGDIDNYNLIQQSKNAYLEAEKAGDNEGMARARNSAEAVRAVYGYKTDSSGNPLPENNIPSAEPNAYKNSYFGADTYEKINKMLEDGWNAYKSLVDSQVSENILFAGRARENVNRNYDNSYKALQKEQDAALTKLPENMAKLGLYGSGAGETAVSNIRSDYLGKIQSLQESKNNALADIDMQIEAIKRNGATQLANYYAEMMNKQPEQFLQMLQLGFGEKQYNDGLYRDDRNFYYTVGKDNREFGYMEERDEKKGKTFNENAYKQSLTPKDSSGGGGSSKVSSVDKNLGMYNTSENIYQMLYDPFKIDTQEYLYSGWETKDINPIYAAKDKLNNNDEVNYMMKVLMENGYGLSAAQNQIEEYKKRVAKEIAKAEGKGKTTKDIMIRYGWAEEE